MASIITCFPRTSIWCQAIRPRSPGFGRSSGASSSAKARLRPRRSLVDAAARPGPFAIISTSWRTIASSRAPTSRGRSSGDGALENSPVLLPRQRLVLPLEEREPARKLLAKLRGGHDVVHDLVVSHDVHVDVLAVVGAQLLHEGLALGAVGDGEDLVLVD